MSAYIYNSGEKLIAFVICLIDYINKSDNIGGVLKKLIKIVGGEKQTNNRHLWFILLHLVSVFCYLSSSY